MFKFLKTFIRKIKKQIRKEILAYNIYSGKYKGMDYIKMTEKLLKGDY